MKRASGIAALLSALAWAPASWAETNNGHDVVMTLDGDFYRGTISDGTAVEIVLLTGKVRAIPQDQIAYAGPEKDAPLLEEEQEQDDSSESSRRDTRKDEATPSVLTDPLARLPGSEEQLRSSLT